MELALFNNFEMKKSIKVLTLVAVTQIFIFSSISCTKKAKEFNKPIVEPTYNLAISKAKIYVHYKIIK